MSDQFVGEIRLFGFPRIPTDWLPCAGQLVSVSEYQVLFALIGTTYGGDGITTFGLPDLRGRVPIHFGQRPGAPSYVVGQRGGAERVTLMADTMPRHGHALTSTTNLASTAAPGTTVHMATGNVGGKADGPLYAAPGAATPYAVMNTQSIGITGQNGDHNNMMPTLVGNWCIAMNGIYPSN